MIKNYFLFIIIFSFTLLIHSQSLTKTDALIWFDNRIDIENTALFNGVEYVEEHRVINDKNKFFETSQFVEGSLIYSGQEFFKVPMKYNIYDGILLARIDHSRGSTILQLINDKIEYFQISGKSFISIPDGSRSQIKGFYQVIHEGDHFTILKKHKKKIRELLDKQAVYYEFENMNHEYIFKYDNKFYHLKERKDLLISFPKLEKPIKAFFRSNRKIFRNSRENFMKALSTNINHWLSSSENVLQE